MNGSAPSDTRSHARAIRAAYLGPRGLAVVRRVLLAGVAYLLLCIPGILLAERGRIPLHESFFHLTQFAVTLPTFAAALVYAICARRSQDVNESASAGTTLEPEWGRSFAVIVIVGILTWWALLAALILWAMTGPAFD